MEILKFGMNKSDFMSTPMTHQLKLNKDKDETLVDATKYQNMIGSMIYLTSSRLVCARCQSRPTKKHLTDVKRIFRYLKGTIHMDLWYPKDYGFELTTYSNEDFIGCKIDMRSTFASFNL